MTCKDNSVCAAVAMVFSVHKKQSILFYHFQGVKPHMIALLLQEEKMWVSKWGVAKFLKTFQTGTIRLRLGSGRPSKVTAKIKVIVEEQMRRDDETTAYQIHRLLVEKGYQLSRRTTRRMQMSTRFGKLECIVFYGKQLFRCTTVVQSYLR